MNIIKKWIGKLRPYNAVKTPIILQQSETECGIAALAILFSYYNFNISFEELRDKCGASRDGCKAITLIKIAQDYGFEAEAYSMDIDAICSLNEPVIAFWNFNHYVIINGIGTDRVFINDPGSGLRTIRMHDFDLSFTGIVIIVTPTDRVAKTKIRSIGVPFLKEWLSGFYIEISYMLLCFLVVVCWPLIYSCLTNIYIDYCVVSGHLEWLPCMTMLAMICSIIFVFAKSFLKWNEFKLSAKASLLKSSKLMHHLLHIPLIYFSLRQKSEIIANLSRVEYVINLLYKCTNTFIGNMLIMMVSVAFMLKLNAKLCIISCCLIIFSYLLTMIISKLNLSYEKSNINYLGKLYAHTLSWIKNLETIKTCGLEDSTLIKWHSMYLKKVHVYDKILYLNAILNFSNKGLNLSSNLIILFVGGLDITNGSISVGSLMAYFSLHLFFCSTANAVFQSIKDSLSAYASHLRMNDITNHPIDPRFGAYQNEDSKFRGHLNNSDPNNNFCNTDVIITCNNLSFFYNKKSNPTLHEISFDIKVGEHIAIVGDTGSGKSTLAKLLCALYQPDQGYISIFGEKLINFSAEQLTRLFAYVSQDVTLFTGTLYDNLVLGDKLANQSTINMAVNDACIDELASTRGLYAIVEENGANFSGGEKQRIDIARALIQNTPILILDEATSALDIQTETKLIRNLQKTKKTIIFVAHRLSTVQHCDNIIVMENGVIKEIGRHSDLIKNERHYFKLVSCI